MTRRIWVVYLSLVGLVAIETATVQAARTVSVVAPVIGVLSALAVLAGVRAHHERDHRPWMVGRPDVWALIGAGLATMVLGDLASRGPLASAGEPVPGLTAVALFLAGLSLVTLALGRMLRACERGMGIDSVFVSAIAAIAVAFPAFIFWFGPEIQAELGAVRAVATVALPTAELFVILLAVRIRRVSATFPMSLRLLVGGLLSLLGAHVAVAVTVRATGTMAVDAVAPAVILGYGLIAAAALHPSMASLLEPISGRTSRLSRGHITLLVLAQLVGPGLLLTQVQRGQSADVRDLVVPTAVLALLVMAHLVRIVQAQAEGEQRADHDELTGLLTRAAFHDRLTLALAHAEQSGSAVAVMFMDLDRFKKVNDTLGHAVGNQLLQLVARRLRRAVRDSDSVARNGGDEFTVLLPALDDPEDAKLVAGKILKAFVEPFSIGKKRLFITPSIGIAVAPRDGADPATLLKNADAAMYRAKEAGRNNAQMYTPDLNAQANEWLDLESDLAVAVERDQLVLHYQPKVDLDSGAIVGVEALLRWQHPRLGLLGPDAFVPLAEESGLILPVGRWVLEQACAQAVAWQESGLPPFLMAVNVSTPQVLHEPLEDVIAQVLRATGLDPRWLELELSEALIHSGDRAHQALRDLRAMGVSCSVDDFGVGLAGLGYLNELPLDRIKIDRSFVSQISSAVGDAAIVIGIIALAHKLGLEVVAEGVETSEQLAFLRKHGCDSMQGYLYSRPLPAAELEGLLAVAASAAPATATPDRAREEGVAGASTMRPHGPDVRTAGDRGEVAGPVG